MPKPYAPLSLKNYTATLVPMPVPGIKSAKDAPLVCATFSERLVPYLLGLLEQYRWGDAFKGTALEVRQAQDVMEELRYILMSATDDCGAGEICRDYLPNSSIIEYAPQDPFTQPNYTPPGYTGPPFAIITNDVLAALFTLEAGDVVTGINGAPVTTPAVGQGLARFRVRVKGAGTIELHLITLPFGGMAMITTSTPLSLPLFVDLVRDVSLVPPANNVVNIQEIVFDDEGDHYVDVTFLPSFGQTVTFVGYGGGLRKVNLCGFEPMQGGGKSGSGASECAIELEDNVRLRINPADKCEWQQDCGDGVWTHFWSISDCGQPTITQPSPQGELQAGQCKVYNVTLQAKEKWIAPVPVGAGYTVEVFGAGGMTFPNVGFLWYCPDGGRNVLGACTGAYDYDVNTPIPAKPRGRVIYDVNGVFHDGYNTTTIIPAGTPLSDLIFQINDANLSDNQGNVFFSVRICAPVAGSFTPETLTLELTSEAGATKSTAQTTDATKLYKITLSGEAFVNFVNGAKCDHFYQTQTNWATHERLTLSGNSCGGTHPNTYIDTVEPAPYPDFVAGHTYVLYKQGTSAPFTFKFCDIAPYSDNSGALTVLVEQQ